MCLLHKGVSGVGVVEALSVFSLEVALQLTEPLDKQPVTLANQTKQLGN